MTMIKTWLLSIVLTAFASSLARQMAPKGRGQTMVRLAGGMLLLLAVVRPLSGLDLSMVSMPTSNFALQKSDWVQEQFSEFSSIIAEKTAAYIWDKAQALGLNCRVSVSVEAGESGIPLPVAVTIRSAYHAGLSAWLDMELGLPADKQIWLEEDEWTTTKKNES